MGFQENITGNLLQLPSGICRQKNSLRFASVGNAALQNRIPLMQSGQLLPLTGQLLDAPANAGFQIPGPDGCGGAIVQGIPVGGENGTSSQPFRRGYAADILQRIAEHNSFPPHGVKIGKSISTDANGRIRYIQMEIKLRRSGDG